MLAPSVAHVLSDDVQVWIFDRPQPLCSQGVRGLIVIMNSVTSATHIKVAEISEIISVEYYWIVSITHK